MRRKRRESIEILALKMLEVLWLGQKLLSGDESHSLQSVDNCRQHCVPTYMANYNKVVLLVYSNPLNYEDAQLPKTDPFFDKISEQSYVFSHYVPS